MKVFTAAILITLSGCSFTLGNDFLIPGGKDRWLTNTFSVHRGEYGVGNDVYTPTNKKNPEIPFGDRPWDGYSYLERKDVFPVAFGQENVLRTRVGALGHASGSDKLQRWVHDDLGLGQHPAGWETQNPSEPAVDVTLSRRSREYLQSVVGDSRLTQEYGGRFGNVIDELFLDQELRKHFGKYFYIFTGITGKAVAFNTHLDGRMFHENTYTVDKQWFVAAARLGVEWIKDRWSFGYTYRYLTEEFKGQDGRHLYGTFEVSLKF